MRSPNDFAATRLFLLGALEARIGTGVSITELVNQPKRLAMLVYLALAPAGRGRRRDELLAMFFPDSSDGPARNALNQTVYRLRAVLGEDALHSTEQEIRLSPDRVWTDAVELRAAAATGDHDRVLSLYRGSLLEAFHVRGVANEFELWLASEREELRALAAAAAWQASDRAAEQGNLIGATDCARTAVRVTPLDDAAVRRLMLLLDRVGDRSGALRAYDEYAQRMTTEYDLAPAPHLVDLSASLRDQPFPAAVPVLAMPKTEHRRRWAAPVAAFAGLGAVLISVAVVVQAKDPPAPILAVGDIHIESAADSALPVELLLSTSIARIAGLSVVTDDRVREVAIQLRAAGKRADQRHAALQAGASEVVEGVLTRRGAVFRLDFRRVDNTERAAYGHVVEAGDLLDLLDLATEQMARDLGLRAPAARSAGTTASLVAYRLYQQGLAALYSDDHQAARRLFGAALEEDSTFAMAAFHAATVTASGREALFNRARTYAARSPERERMFITARVAQALVEPGGFAVAETLATRYPRDPEAAMVFGDGLLQHGRFAEAQRQFKRAAELDSMSIHTSELRCRACEAHRLIRDTYLLMDSAAAVEREARAWLRAYPDSKHAWSGLAQALESIERFAEAEVAFARAGDAPYKRNADHMTGVWIRQLRFDDVDAHWQNVLRTGDITARKNAYWGRYISMRTQGRLDDALLAARGYRELQGDALLEALALLELGRYREAAREFEGLAAPWRGETKPVLARRVAWHLTHAASAYAALRDTVKLRMIEDTVRVYGARSGSPRDTLLHHYVRGLRLRVQGREREAAHELETSTMSAHFGYVRQPLELARASLATGNPKRAIEVLRPALRGPVSSTGLYASRTELMELLGDAYARIEQRDSAAAVYARVLASWKSADPRLQPRVASVRARLNALQPDR